MGWTIVLKNGEKIDINPTSRCFFSDEIYSEYEGNLRQLHTAVANQETKIVRIGEKNIYILSSEVAAIFHQ